MTESKITFLHHLTIVPSVIVGDSDGIFTSVPGVDPPVGWAAASPAAAPADAPAAATGDSAAADDATTFQSSPSSAKTAIGVPTC